LGLKNEILSLKTEIVRIKADKFTFASWIINISDGNIIFLSNGVTCVRK
jgi:hypothetical protein